MGHKKETVRVEEKEETHFFPIYFLTSCLLVAPEYYVSNALPWQQQFFPVEQLLSFSAVFRHL
jgi:hypothetical protein